MSVTAIPVLPAGARRAPYIAANGDRVLPGCYGVSRGVGITGDLIRHATGSRPGHAFIYVGHGRIVEVVPPGVRIAPVASHPDALWNARFPLTGAQRERICARALALVGRQYEYPAYTGFALKVLKPREDAELDPVFKADHWQVCSALVADCYAYAGIRLEPGLKDLSLSRTVGLDTWAARPA
jgi:hypothetical protein